jgi:hypothetical protein
MDRLAPSEKVLIGHCLYSMLGTAYRTGELSIFVSHGLTLKFTPDQIRKVIDKLEIYENRDITDR